MRLDAYYYGFKPTRVPEIDRILSAVAAAGKAYHDTSQWTEPTGAFRGHDGVAPVDWIQNAADAAAETINALRGRRSDDR